MAQSTSPVHIQHSPALWAEHPDLAAGAVFAGRITPDADVEQRVAAYYARAQERLDAGPATGFPEIQAWRRTFAKMGLKPTQYRCASEALLRRFAKEGALPSIHPVIDLCNAISLAYAVPVGVFDVAAVAGGLEVRHATGAEEYLTFGGEIERPEPGEVIFADEAGRAHARRWTNRQSGRSAVRPGTAAVLVVTEALHETAQADVAELTKTLAEELGAVWSGPLDSALLSASMPRFECGRGDLNPHGVSTNRT